MASQVRANIPLEVRHGGISESEWNLQDSQIQRALAKRTGQASHQWDLQDSQIQTAITNRIGQLPQQGSIQEPIPVSLNNCEIPKQKLYTFLHGSLIGGVITAIVLGIIFGPLSALIGLVFGGLIGGISSKLIDKNLFTRPSNDICL